MALIAASTAAYLYKYHDNSTSSATKPEMCINHILKAGIINSSDTVNNKSNE